MNYVLHIQIKKKNPHPVKLIFLKQNIRKYIVLFSQKNVKLD